VIGATVGSLSSSRQAAIRDTLIGEQAAIVDRFFASQDKILTRWIVLRVGGVAATAALLGEKLSLIAPHFGQLLVPAWLLAWVIAVGTYALPSEGLRQYARPRAEALFPKLLSVARYGEWLVAPIADPLFWLVTRFSAARSRDASPTLTETEVEMLVNEGELSGALDHEQSEMIRNVLDFGEVTAEEVMVPRTQMDALDAELTIEEALSEATRTQHSRYPVFTESTDNVVGILHIKDLFHAMVHDAARSKRLIDLVRRPVPFVSEGQLASSVLKDMRAGRHHMAVVLDEFGGVSGILTLEDLLEEIVGDIQDEHDQDEAARIVMVGAHTARVDAATPIADINRTIGTELPEGDYVSVGGLIIEQLGKVPRKGTSHELFGLKVVIVDSDQRHIAKVELSEVPGVPKNPTNRPPASAA
jgi:CBS domain containing-hemolysin-like protein